MEPVEIVSVEVPFPPLCTVTVAGLNDAVGPVVEMVAVRLTLPENPEPAETVMVRVPLDWTWMLVEAGLEARPKGVAFTVTVSVWVIESPTPLIVTAYVPIVEDEHARVDVVEPGLMFEGLREHVMPAGLDTVALTDPANPFRAVAEI